MAIMRTAGAGTNDPNVLEYSKYRHFLPVLDRARESCRKSGHKVEDHFEDILDMVAIGSGAKREIAQADYDLKVPQKSIGRQLTTLKNYVHASQESHRKISSYRDPGQAIADHFGDINKMVT